MPVSNGTKSAATPKGKGGRAAQDTTSRSSRRRANRRQAASGVPQPRPLQTGAGRTSRRQETIRVPVSCRLTPAQAENDQAFVINPSCTRLMRETVGIDTTTGLNGPTVATPYSASEYTGVDEWTMAQGNLYSKSRLISGTIEWVPRTGLTAKGEIVMGQLLDATDILPNREVGASVNTSRLTSAWDGRPADIEALSGSKSGPIRDPLRFPIRSSGEWSKVDRTRAFDGVKAHATGTGPFVAEWEREIQEGVLHYLKDGLILGHTQGLGDTGGGQLANLDEAGHFRLTAVVEFGGRNTTAGVHVTQPNEPPSVVRSDPPLAVGAGGIKVEPVQLSKRFTHSLRLDEQRVRRGGPESLTSPFGGVSVEPPDPEGQARPYWKHIIQYDPDKAGFGHGLLRVVGARVLEGDFVDLKAEQVKEPDDSGCSGIVESYLASSLSSRSRFSVVSKNGVIEIFSRPVDFSGPDY